MQEGTDPRTVEVEEQPTQLRIHFSKPDRVKMTNFLVLDGMKKGRRTLSLSAPFHYSADR